MEEVKKQTYYKQNIPDLISDLKVAVANNRSVITQKVTTDLTEDRYLNVLKARRMAAEDTIYFLQEIDRLEDELLDIPKEENKDGESSVHPSKRRARN